MNEDYLWNRTGDPDPEIVRLEELLGQFKYSGKFAAPRPAPRRWWLAAAAIVIVGLLSAPMVLRLRGPLTKWQLPNGRLLRAGQWIETGAARPTKIEANDTGQVTIDPGSHLRLVAANDREQRFDLQHGTIHAFIWAPPGKFVVDTPSSKTIDLGCRYTLQVSKNGTGVLTVEFGWVAFERNQQESFIPAGAACVTRPERGPGTPYFTDASDKLRDSLARFDTGSDPAALHEALISARPRDALSLWHLMLRTQGKQRADVFDRFASLVELPADVTREAVLRGDGNAADAAWNALKLGDTDWWRGWKRKW